MRDRIGIDATAATNLSVVGNDFLGEQLYGIRSRNNFFPNQIRIAENTIDVSETNNVAGILLERTVAATGLHNVIEGNYLTMAGSTDGKYGIHVTSPFAASDKMEIIDNIIDMTSTGDVLFPIHVDANLADRFHILDNTVNFNSSNQGAERFGIVMVEGQGEAHLIKENNVIGSGTHNPGHCGLHIVNVLNTTICSNTVNHTQWGIHLWGALDPCKLQNNHMNLHEIGLFLSPSPPSVAGIGPQIRHGNTWSTSHGAYSTWAAQCATGVNYLLSPIYVEDTAPSSLNPSSALLSPSTGWFIYDPGDENYCAPLPPSFGENLSSIQEETATNNLSTYIETSLDQWQMEYNLMLSLRNNPALLGMLLL